MMLDTRESIYLVFLFFIVIISAFFSGSETAFMRVNRFRIRHLSDKGKPDATRVNKILDDPESLISTILMGNNFINVLASAMATALFISMFGEKGIVYSTIAMTIILLIFAEITPKTMAAYHADEISMFVSRPIQWLIGVLRPFARLLNFVSRGLLSIFGVSMDREDTLTEEDVGSAISMGHKEGFIAEPKARMLIAIMDMDSVPVKKVMIPLNEMVLIPLKTSFDEMIEVIKTQNFSRYPIFKDNQENILGYIHIRDMWKMIDKRHDFRVEGLIREARFVPETKPILSQLMDFQKMHMHMAFVVDEYGTLKGAITLEDVIEEITGEIIDEHDDAYTAIIPVGTDSFLVRGNISLRDLSRYMDVAFSEEYDTLSGLIYGILDRIPKAGEEVVWDDVMAIKIERMMGNHIQRVRITMHGHAPED
ncbi:MAG: CNNM domain-containing protein [Thermodesulfobacteriota bacterium]|nr:CNNM domain-containing protein [Thermodesulfobacteriota bacterium]